MPTYPVRCPRCDADLVVGRELLNRPVACGGCGRAFVPVMAPDGPEPDELPPKPKRSFGEGFGVLALVLGILAFPFCCCGTLPFVLGGGAVVSGLIGLRVKSGRGLSVAGLTLGVVALLLQLTIRLLGWRNEVFGPF